MNGGKDAPGCRRRLPLLQDHAGGCPRRPGRRGSGDPGRRGDCRRWAGRRITVVGAMHSFAHPSWLRSIPMAGRYAHRNTSQGMHRPRPRRRVYGRAEGEAVEKLCRLREMCARWSNRVLVRRVAPARRVGRREGGCVLSPLTRVHACTRSTQERGCVVLSPYQRCNAATVQPVDWISSIRVRNRRGGKITVRP